MDEVMSSSRTFARGPLNERVGHVLVSRAIEAMLAHAGEHARRMAVPLDWTSLLITGTADDEGMVHINVQMMLEREGAPEEGGLSAWQHELTKRALRIAELEHEVAEKHGAIATMLHAAEANRVVLDSERAVIAAVRAQLMARGPVGLNPQEVRALVRLIDGEDATEAAREAERQYRPDAGQ